MKIGILQCDDVQPEFQAEFGNYPEMVISMLECVAKGWDFQIYQSHRSQLPLSSAECDAYVMTGSRHSVNDEFPWMRRLERFIQQLDQAEMKFVGICFGHQLMAKALGGRVAKSDKGWGIGAAVCRVHSVSEWMHPLRRDLNLIISHQDQVVELPERIRVLAGNDFCPNYMLLRGKHMLTVQGHPEFSKAYSRALMDSRKGFIAAGLIERARRSLSAEVHGLTMARWVANFLKSRAI